MDGGHLMRTLLHPRLLVSSLSLLVIYAGMVTLTINTPSFQHYPIVWGWLSVAAGLLGLVAAYRCGKLLLAWAGAALVVMFTARFVAVVETVLVLDQVSPDASATLAIQAAQWITMAYVTLALFRRVIIPWAALQRAV